MMWQIYKGNWTDMEWINYRSLIKDKKWLENITMSNTTVNNRFKGWEGWWCQPITIAAAIRNQREIYK